MRSLIARRKHVDLTQAIAAFYDPNTPTRDAVALWRKALRRADKDMKDLLLSMARQAKGKENRRKLVSGKQKGVPEENPFQITGRLLMRLASETGRQVAAAA